MTKPYKHKLTTIQLEHLKAFGITNMKGIKRQMENLAKERKTTKFEPCWACRGIAKRLELPA